MRSIFCLLIVFALVVLGATNPRPQNGGIANINYGYAYVPSHGGNQESSGSHVGKQGSNIGSNGDRVVGTG